MLIRIEITNASIVDSENQQGADLDSDALDALGAEIEETINNTEYEAGGQTIRIVNAEVVIQ